jgi:GNAT superfamily N-acetyltransferase
MIRKASVQDVPRIAALSRRWAEEEVTFAYPAASEEQIARRLGDYCWVAERGGGGELAGYTIGAVRTSQYPVFPMDAPFLEIQEAYVHPDERGAGIGQRLIDSLLEEARSRGITHSMVGSSNLDWRRIAGFYEKKGFKMWYVQMYQ